MGIKPDDDIVNILLKGVLPEFESAAGNITRNETSGRGPALWSLQMAVEKTLKAFAQHKIGEFRYSHDLFSLYDDVKNHGISAKRTLLNKMPRVQQIKSFRYGLGDIPSITDVMNAYDAALMFVSQTSQSFDRDVCVGGARFLLKKPPWLELPKINETR